MGSHHSAHASDICPKPADGVRQFEVGDELVLIASGYKSDCENEKSDGSNAIRFGGGNTAATLNASGRLIWDLCDGSTPVDQIVSQLSEEFGIEETLLVEQVRGLLSSLQRQSILSGYAEKALDRPATVFTVGLEDKPYFWWQTAIFLESLNGKLPFGWRPFVVVCNNHEPITPQLREILDAYNVGFVTAVNHAETYPLDIGLNGGVCHSGMNKIEALAAVAPHVDDDEVIFLLDTDMFLFDQLDLSVMPTGCSLVRNWHIEHEPFLASIPDNKDGGIDLRKLLDAMGIEAEFKPGGVNIFVTGAVAKNPKYIADCFRFAQALLLLGRASGAKDTWMSEMPCYALAMISNGVEYDLLTDEQLLISACSEETIPSGTFYHYYSDPTASGNAGFFQSQWHKQAYQGTNFLEEDIEPLLEQASTDHERYFFQLALTAKEKLNA